MEKSQTTVRSMSPFINATHSLNQIAELRGMIDAIKTRSRAGEKPAGNMSPNRP